MRIMIRIEDRKSVAYHLSPDELTILIPGEGKIRSLESLQFPARFLRRWPAPWHVLTRQG